MKATVDTTLTGDSLPHPFQNWSIYDSIAPLVIIGVTLLLRIFNLRTLPLFIDEAIHLNWAVEKVVRDVWIVGNDVGKYLYIWIVSFLVPYSNDIIETGRLVSGVSDAVSALLIYLLGRTLFDRQVATVAAIIFATAPYSVIYGRMALVDSFLTMLGLLILLLSLYFFEHGWTVRVGGIVLAGAVATKMSGILFLAIPMIVLFVWPRQTTARAWLTVEHAILIGLIGILPSLTNLGNYELIFEQKSMLDNQIPIYNVWFGNLGATVNYFTAYMSFVLIGLAVVGAVLGAMRRLRPILLLVLAGLICVVFFVVTAEPGWFLPRYLYPSVPYVSLLAAFGFCTLYRQAVATAETRNWATIRPQFRTATLLATFLLLLLLTTDNLSQSQRLTTNPFAFEWVAQDQHHYHHQQFNIANLPAIKEMVTARLSSDPAQELTIFFIGNYPMGHGLMIDLYPAYGSRLTVINFPYEVGLLEALTNFEANRGSQQFMLIDYVVNTPTDPFHDWPYVRRADALSARSVVTGEPVAGEIVLFEANPDWHPE